MAVGLRATVQRWLGLSTDSKPTTGIPVGSLFYETDTGKDYIFNGTSWIAKP